MNEDLIKKISLDVRLRSWLIRLICGQHKIESLATRVDKTVLHVTVETMYETLLAHTNSMLSKTTTQLPKETLSEIIAQNRHLSDLQKQQIANILATSTNVNNSRSYLQ
jgi:hypothetical protein